MPIVRIDLLDGRTPEQVRQISDAVHQAIVEVFQIPQRDRLHVIAQKRG